MLEKLLKNKIRILYVFILIAALVSIRMFEDVLFYDPFLKYYRIDTNLPFPDYKIFKLFGGLLFRYGLNTAISLALIQILFTDMDLTKFSAFLYVIIFSVLIVLFFIVLECFGHQSKLELFYIRRFLIQPILLLLFLPGLYFQKMYSKK